MFPAVCDVSVLSKIDLNNPKIEFVNCITTLDKGNKGTLLDLSYFLINDFKMDKYPKYVGTTIISVSDISFIFGIIECLILGRMLACGLREFINLDLIGSPMFLILQL